MADAEQNKFYVVTFGNVALITNIQGNILNSKRQNNANNVKIQNWRCPLRSGGDDELAKRRGKRGEKRRGRKCVFIKSNNPHRWGTAKNMQVKQAKHKKLPTEKVSFQKQRSCLRSLRINKHFPAKNILCSFHTCLERIMQLEVIVFTFHVNQKPESLRRCTPQICNTVYINYQESRL